MTRQDAARWLLGVIRLVNGVIALVAPRMIIKRFGDESDMPVARYALRMFGIRTILVAIDVLAPGDHRRRAIKMAPIIHASDTVAAILAARSGRVATETGVLIVSISAMNTLLSLLMQGEGAEPEFDEG